MDASGDVPFSHFYQRADWHESQGPRSPPIRKDAEHYAADAMACDMDESITYSPGVMNEPIDDWLRDNRPSMLKRSDHVGWIEVFGPNEEETRVQPDVVALQAAWERLQRSGEPINKRTITHQAKSYGVTSGKWMFHVDTGDKADIMWSVVAKAMVCGNLAHYAKISPCNEAESLSHVCCIYNDDFTDEEQVFALEHRIRAIGIRTFLNYKPDVYTYLGIYRNNRWQLRPTIYESRYDAILKQSKITIPEGHLPDMRM